MKKIILYIIVSLVYVNVQAQKPEQNCKQTNIFKTNSITTITKDSIALPSDSIGQFNSGPEKDLGDKVVVFMHGLAGASTTWSRAGAHSHDDYYVINRHPVYDQDTDIEGTWGGLDNEISDYNDLNGIANPGYDPKETIVIAHSLGGVMTRYMDKKYQEDPTQEREFGAFATFGSPHAGAAIIANIDDLNTYLVETCNVMTEPYVLEFLTALEDEIYDFLPGWVTTVFSGGIKKLIHALESGTQILQGAICEEVLNLGFDGVEAIIAPPIGLDVAPGSNVIQELAGFETTTPSLAFYGEEEAPISWREIYSLQNNVNALLWGEANEDDGYIDPVNEIGNQLYMAYEYHNLHLVSVPVSTFYFYLEIPIPPSIDNQCGGVPFCLASWCEQHNSDYDLENNTCISICDLPCQINRCLTEGGEFDSQTLQCNSEVSNQYPETTQAYYDAWIWWNDFDRNYRILFGHLEFELAITSFETESTCNCYFTSEPDVIEDTFPFPCEDIDYEFNSNVYSCIESTEQIPIYSLVEVNHPGDGVSTAFSAKSFPGVRASTLMDKSNHQQMRNDKNTKQAFAKMYGGDFGIEFKQRERE